MFFVNHRLVFSQVLKCARRKKFEYWFFIHKWLREIKKYFHHRLELFFPDTFMLIFNIYPKTPPARTSAWLDNVSAITSSLYMATGVLYCLLVMLRTGDGGICWESLKRFVKNLCACLKFCNIYKWPCCRVVSTAKIAYLLLVGSKRCLCDWCIVSGNWRWSSRSKWCYWWLPCGTATVNKNFFEVRKKFFRIYFIVSYLNVEKNDFFKLRTNDSKI